MKTRFTVDVTEQDIGDGWRNNSSRCVVVRAVARTVPGSSGIRVDTQTIRFRVGDKRYQYLTPAAAAQYVVDFDAGDAIKPFSFQLRDPREVAVRLRTPKGQALIAENTRRRRQAKTDGTTPEYESLAGHETQKGKKPTRLVFGSGGRRMYGQRVLRYNQDRAKGYVIGPDGEMQFPQ